MQSHLPIFGEINTEEEGTPDRIKTLVEKLRQTAAGPSLSNPVSMSPMKTVSKDTLQYPGSMQRSSLTPGLPKKEKKYDSYYSMTGGT